MKQLSVAGSPFSILSY